MKMKKRMLTLLLGAALMLCACQSGGETPTTQTPSADTPTDAATEPSTQNPTDAATGPSYEQLDYKSIPVNNDDVSMEALEASYLNQGNLARLANVLDKAARGEEITIAFLGGSTTEGMCASRPGYRYPNQVAKWFRDTYPDAKINLINAGIGSTGSIIGGGRFYEEILQYKPDLISIEFSCNDRVDALDTESYEGVIYRALTAENSPAVMLMYLCFEDGTGAQTVEIPVGLKYDLPMISYANWFRATVINGDKTTEDFIVSAHPNDRGHTLIASLYIHRLELVKANLDKIDRTIPPVPETQSRFVSQMLYNSKNYDPISAGAFVPAEKQYYTNESLSNGWTAKAGNTEPFVFETESKVVTLVFKRQIISPGAKLQVLVDGKEVMVIDSNGGSAEYADLRTILNREETTKVKVELRLTEDSPANSQFLLLGVIA